VVQGGPSVTTFRIHFRLFLFFEDWGEFFVSSDWPGGCGNSPEEVGVLEC